MTAGTLPLEILTRIVQYIRSSDVAPLCRVNRSFQRVAERRLYSYLVFGDIQAAYLACVSMIANDGARGAYVKRFWFYLDPRRAARGAIPQQFWQTVQLALNTMSELRDLLIHDPTGTATWILDPEHLKFQLHSAKFRLFWDEYMVAFLHTQTELKNLQTIDHPESNMLFALPDGSLPALETFDGPLLVAAELLSCPNLTRIRTAVDNELFQLLPQFVDSAVVSETPLCSLHVNIIPESILADTLEALTSNPKWCVRLKYIGTIVMPWGNRNIIHRHLAKMHNLESIAFEISHLDPAPLEIMQRAFAMEMHMYRPSLLRVAFWTGQQQVNLWVYHQEKWILSGMRSAAQLEEHLWFYS